MKIIIFIALLTFLGTPNVNSQELFLEHPDIHCRHGLNTYIEGQTNVIKKFDDTRNISTIFEYGWPHKVNNDNGVFIINYVDHDPGNGFTDYEGGNIHGYNGHLGTDISLYSFVDMDRGVPIISVDDGVVISTIYDQFDRNIQLPYIGTGNGVTVEHDDGTRAIYWHLRKYSVTVEPGEIISKGQVIGLTGSSGWTPIPHLHLEFWVPDGNGNTSSIRDPFTGAINNLPSMWEDQPQYVGDDPLKVLDMGVFTRTTAWGNENLLDINDMKLKLTEPAVIGINEPILGTWVLLQGYGSNNLTVEIRKPDGSVYNSTTYSLPSAIRYGYFPISTPWNSITVNDFGEWKVNIKRGAEILNSKSFTVDQETKIPPRFWPVAGKSFRINGSVQYDTLRVLDYGNEFTFNIINGSNAISLTDSVLTIAGISDQSYRSYYFQVVVENNFGYSDTMWYHLVDHSKPLDEITGVNVNEPEIGMVNNFHLFQNYPNPFNPSTTINYFILSREFVTLKIYNSLGSEVTTLINAEQSSGHHSAVWDGTDYLGNKVSSGIYLYELRAANNYKTMKMILIK